MSNRYDYIILGAGGAGRWLAVEMHRAGLHRHKRITLVERDKKVNNDRTWCFWVRDQQDDVLNNIIVHEWKYNRFGESPKPLAPYRYAYVPSSRFYEHTNDLLPMIRANVKDIKTTAEDVEVHTDGGVLYAKLVFNSLINPSMHTYFQSFYGWKLRWDQPVFDADSIRLMDFDIPQDNSIQFAYVLPFSDREALVEMTRFSPHHIAKNEAEQLRDMYLSAHPNFEVLEEEYGAIPMTTTLDEPRKHHPKALRVIPIGMHGGATKPTTGYTFLRMRAHARHIVQALITESALPTTYRLWRFRFYDRLLLDVLQRHPSRGKLIFNRLFANVPHDVILRFLEEKTSIWEELRIVNALPKGLFLRALIRDVL